jgi:apolipoprotein N-acyltransferase
MQVTEIRVEELSARRPQNWWRYFVYLEKVPIALTFGALLGLSAPGFEQGWLAWCGLAPLLVLIAVSRAPSEALLLGFFYGLGYHLVAQTWYFGLSPLRWLGLDDTAALQKLFALWLIQGCRQSLLYAAFAWLVASVPLRPGFLPQPRRPFFSYLVFVPLIWYFLHWIVSMPICLFGNPVNQLAYSQSTNLAFIQLAKLGGAGIIDFVLVMVNAALAACLIEFTKFGQQPVERVDALSPRIGAVFDLSLILAMVLLTMAWGSSVVSDYGNLESYHKINVTAQKSPRLPLAIVQPNVTIEESRAETTSGAEIFKRKQELSQGLPVSLIVLPEAAADAEGRTPSAFTHWLEALAINEKKTIVVGEITQQNRATINSACLLSPSRQRRQIYRKCRELDFFDCSSSDARLKQPSLWQNLALQDLTPAITSKPELLNSDWGKIGVANAAEVLYPSLTSREVRDGASLLINISDLACFHNAKLEKQLRAAAIFRAIENERFLIIASNTGSSAVINPAGIVTSLSLVGRKGTLIDTVQFLVEKTPFTKMWWL